MTVFGAMFLWAMFFSVVLTLGICIGAELVTAIQRRLQEMR